jgi:hypothetical protein
VNDYCEFCGREQSKLFQILEGKPLFGALYGIYILTLHELTAVLKVNAQARQSGAVTETSLESTAHDDKFQEVKRHKKHISIDTSVSCILDR